MSLEKQEMVSCLRKSIFKTSSWSAFEKAGNSQGSMPFTRWKCLSESRSIMGRGIRCVFCGNVEIDRYTAVSVSSASCLLAFCFLCDCWILFAGRWLTGWIVGFASYVIARFCVPSTREEISQMDTLSTTAGLRIDQGR